MAAPSNTLLTPTKITRKALAILHQKIGFIGSINRQYDQEYSVSGAKIGSTLTIRLPNQFPIRSGATLSPTDLAEPSTTMTMATQKGVDLNFSMAELTLTIDDFADRYLEPAMARLASEMEKDAFTMYQDVYNQVGTAGTTPSSLLTVLSARKKLNQMLAPIDNNRYVQMDAEMSAAMVDGLKGLFNDPGQISKQYREGIIGRNSGFDYYENQITPVHTNGSMAGYANFLVNGATQTGSTLACDGLTGSAVLARGTVFTIAGVYAVHPETKVAYPWLQQFVVAGTTATQTASAGAFAALPISPSIITSGAYQTVNASPANDAQITVVGAASTGYTQNLAYHRDAFAFVSADLEKPEGVHFASRQQYDGISMRIVRAYDINYDTIPCRIDVLYGYKTVRPSLACRMTG